jgi:hypothetical protein
MKKGWTQCHARDRRSIVSQGVVYEDGAEFGAMA